MIYKNKFYNNFSMKENLEGLVHIYYGNGKGKTTAAIGLGVRAALNSFDVYMIQFMKGNIDYGELKISKYIPNFKIIQYGRKEFVNKNNPKEIDIKLAKKAFRHAKKIINSGKYDLVILDEINYAINYMLLKLEDVINLIDNKPKNVELVLTGNYTSKKLEEKADYVTRMVNCKHPFQKGILARKGIEY